MNITKDQLVQLGVSESNAEKYIDSLNATLNKYEIVYPVRLSHFLAQTLVECQWLKYTKETSSGEQYENNSALGNTQPGDGHRFLGRGACQLTGRAAYQKYSDFTKQDFISHPELLEGVDLAWDSAGWFWTKFKVDNHGNNLNFYADDNNFVRVLYSLNGGFTAINTRWDMLKKCLRLLDSVESEAKIKQIRDQVTANITATDRTPMWNLLYRTIPNTNALNQILSA